MQSLTLASMDFDFYKTYSAYSAVQLLQILAEPHKYQPQAVQAAEEILATRDIGEIQQAQEAMQTPVVIEAIPAAKTEKITSIFDEAEDHAAALLQLRLWYGVVVLLGIIQAYRVFKLASAVWIFRTPAFLFYSLFSVFSTAINLLEVLALILFIQKKLFSWGLLMILVTFDLGSYAFWLVAGIYRTSRDLTTPILMTLVYAASAILLYRPAVRVMYEVDARRGQHFVLAGVGITILFNVILLLGLL